MLCGPAPGTVAGPHVFTGAMQMETTMAKKKKDGESKILEFSLTRIEQPVTIDGRKYVLIEMDGKQRDTYLNGLGQRVRHTAEGKPAGLKDFNGLQASLLSQCLFEEENAENTARKPVPFATIQGWPARVLTGLYEEAREMNGLGEEDEAEEKGNE